MIQRTTIVIETTEPVTPAWIAQRVAEACARYGALRPGEAVCLPQDGQATRRWEVQHLDEPLPSPFD